MIQLLIIETYIANNWLWQHDLFKTEQADMLKMHNRYAKLDYPNRFFWFITAPTPNEILN
jgi:hypothetical protein